MNYCIFVCIYIYIQIQLCVIGSQFCYISAFCHVIVKKCHVASQDANVLASCGGCSILGFLRKLNRYIALKWDILSTTNPKSDNTEVCHTLPPGQYPTLANDQVMPRDSSMVKLTLKKISNPNQTSANWSPSGSTHFLEKSCFVEWKRNISWTKHFLSLSSLGLCQLVLQQWLQWKHPQCLQRKEELRGTTFFGVQKLQYIVCRIDSGLCGISCTLWILNIAIAMNRHACIIYSILYLSIGHTVHVDMLHMPYNFTSARLIFQ